MPFSFDWFLTIPGMLISFGIILLVIAIIMFVIGSSSPKEKVVKKEKVDKVDKKEVKDIVVDIDDNDIENINIDFSELENKNEDNDDSNKVEDDERNIVIEEPVKDLENTEIKKIDDIPELQENIINDSEEINVSDIKINEETPKTTIYGGADPLEATRELPKVDVRHVPYSGGKEEVKIPTVERIPDDFAFQPVIEEIKKVETPSSKKTLDIKPIEDNQNSSIKFSDKVIEIPDDAGEL